MTGPAGILSDHDLELALSNGEFLLKPPASLEQLQPCSVDLRLGGEFIFEREGFHENEAGEAVWGAYTERVEFSEGRLVPIPSGAFVLATTLERIELSPSLVGFVSGRSSVGRTGLFVENAGLIDPGFRGQITLELFNASRFPREVRVGSRICQVTLERLASPPRHPYGHPARQSKYQDQQGVTRSRWEELDNSQPIR